MLEFQTLDRNDIAIDPEEVSVVENNKGLAVLYMKNGRIICLDHSYEGARNTIEANRKDSSPPTRVRKDVR